MDFSAFEAGGALHALTAYKNWMLYRLTGWDTAKNKWSKEPVDARGYLLPWRSKPERLMSYEQARLAARQASPTGYSAGDTILGFVLTENDPFFILDLDHQLVNGSWSQTSLDLVASLPGCAVEVSASGDGLHVIGSTADLPHICVNDDIGVEFYTKYRSVALTGRVSGGDASTDATLQVFSLVDKYFRRPERTASRRDGTTKADLEKARDAIPFIDKNLHYDHWLSVCMGLHAAGVDAEEEDLAFEIAQEYTQASPKYVPGYLDYKWGSFNSDREDRATLGTLFHFAKEGGYKTREEIAAAEALAAIQPPADVPPPPAPGAPPPPVDAEPLNRRGNLIDVFIENLEGGIQYPTDYLELFSKFTYVASLHGIWTPGGDVYDHKTFDAMFSGHSFALDMEGRKIVDSPWDAFFKCRVYKFKRVQRDCFRPDLHPGAVISHEGKTYLNTYVPVTVASRPGDITPFLEHLAKLLPDARDQQILLGYMAAVVQYPGVKFQWAPLIQGWEGNGKSFFTRCLEAAVGEIYTHYVAVNDLDNKFNAWQQGKILVAVEDVYVPGHKSSTIEILKPLITNERTPIQGKGKDQITRSVCCNYIFNSNHRDALGRAVKGRRYCVFYCAQQTEADNLRDGIDHAYALRLKNWFEGGGFAVVTHYLQTYVIPAEYNPTLVVTAPKTSTYSEVMAEAAGPIEQEILAAVEEERPGFIGPWISSIAVDRLLSTMRKEGVVPRNRRRALIESLGYVRHPALPDGRTNNPVLPDNSRTTLFVKSGHPALALGTAAAVADRYTKTQLNDPSLKNEVIENAKP